MEIQRYLEQIVNPTIKDIEANPTSVRHAFLAALAVFHSIDYLPRRSKSPSGLRDRFRKRCADFAIVDRIAHAFKHVEAGSDHNPDHQPLSAKGVIARSPAYYNKSGAYGLSRWNDPIGGVTLDSERHIDVLSAVKGAAEFVRLQIGP
jgi:hypothetical protein